jgi:hypothetical protein
MYLNIKPTNEKKKKKIRFIDAISEQFKTINGAS